jgi:hypothetical protein
MPYVFPDIYNNADDETGGSALGNYRQYSGDDFIEKFTTIKNHYDNIAKYKVVKIEYDYDPFSLYDYGYPPRR